MQPEPVSELEIEGVDGGSGEGILERTALFCEAFQALRDAKIASSLPLQWKDGQVQLILRIY
jgi:hypothetical protein